MAKEPANLVAPRGSVYQDVEPMGQPRAIIPVGDVAMRMQSKIVTAQKVALPRNEPAVRQRLISMAAAAGEKYFYSIPYGGKGGGTMVMGPSVKLTSDAARVWGNCEVNCEYVAETESHFVFDGVFIDYETGYVLRRPYLQRKDQDVGIKDRSRALDQVFQIAASKATRNVIYRAIPEIVDAAYEAAQQGLVEKVGKNPDAYRERITTFLADEGVPLARVERLYGKPLDKMSNNDLAKLSSQCVAVKDNMIQADECWPAEEGEAPTKKPDPAAKPKAEPKKEATAKKEEAKPAAAEEKKTADPEPKKEEAKADAPKEAEAKPAKQEEPAAAEDEASGEETKAPGELMFD